MVKEKAVYKLGFVSTESSRRSQPIPGALFVYFGWIFREKKCQAVPLKLLIFDFYTSYAVMVNGPTLVLTDIYYLSIQSINY